MARQLLPITLKPYAKGWDVFLEEQRIGHVREHGGPALLVVSCFRRRIGHVRRSGTEAEPTFVAFSAFILNFFAPVPTLTEALARLFTLYRRLVVNLGELPDPDLLRRYADGER